MKTPIPKTAETITNEDLGKAHRALDTASNSMHVLRGEAIQGAVSPAEAARQYNALIKELLKSL